MFKNFTRISKGKNYLVWDIFDLDEIVRIYGKCQHDEDYKIERLYYYWEWEGEEGKVDIPTTKEDFEKNKDNEEDNYRTELNYRDFEDKFWFQEVTQFLIEIIEPQEQMDFISGVKDAFNNINFEGQAIFFLKDVLIGLIGYVENLKNISKRREEVGLSKTNKIQNFVINLYLESYNNTIQILSKYYGSIYPEIVEGFVKTEYESKLVSKINIKKLFIENPYPEIFNNSTAFLLFKKLHENYKNNTHQLADYSFIFYAMAKDNFLSCGNSGFIKFLAEYYDVFIDKIDSRQVGSNKRTAYYTALKETMDNKY
jgi:hypothetical protein